MHPLATTVIGSYPQPDWLIDRKKLAGRLPPRVPARELWRVDEPWLEEAQDDATRLAVRDMEDAGIDVVTDGEIRRESYSNYFANALEGLDLDEPGTAIDRVVPLRDGRLVAYLHDSYTARRGGATSTGNASRASYRSPPSVSASNLMIEPGEPSLEGLLYGAGDGVYVTEVAGLHSGVNPVTGRYSVGATGKAIREGALAEPLREFTIAGDLLGTLAAVQAVGSESRWVPFGGSVHSAPILVGEYSTGTSIASQADARGHPSAGRIATRPACRSPGDRRAAHFVVHSPGSPEGLIGRATG